LYCDLAGCCVHPFTPPDLLAEFFSSAKTTFGFVIVFRHMMETSTSSYASKLRGGGGGRFSSSSSRPPVQDPSLHHIPALSENAIFIVLRVVKPPVDQAERNDFLLKDLQVSVDEIADILPEPESQLLRLVFFTEDQYQHYLARLTAGVPWAARNGALVFGWAPSETVTAVRLTGVPANLPEAEYGCISQQRQSFHQSLQWHCPHLHRRRPWFRPARLCFPSG
jgi:hypothetical protein